MVLIEPRFEELPDYWPAEICVALPKAPLPDLPITVVYRVVEECPVRCDVCGVTATISGTTIYCGCMAMIEGIIKRIVDFDIDSVNWNVILMQASRNTKGGLR